MKIKIICYIVAFAMLACVCLLTSCSKVDKDDESEDKEKQEEKSEDSIYQQIAVFSQNHSLNLSEMAYLYRTTYNDFYQRNSQYMSYLGIDTSKSFKDQPCTIVEEDGYTWFDYFIDQTIDYAKETFVLCEVAEKNGAGLTEEMKQVINDNIASFKKNVEDAGYDFDEYLAMAYKNEITEKEIYNALCITRVANNYYSELSKKFTYTEEDYQKFIAENYSVTEDYKTVNVRHILVSEEELANQLLEQINSAEKKVDTFKALCAAYSSDGTKDTGGLYTDVYKGEMVAEFENWCFDKARQVGDTGIVKTQYGYHVMYFEGFGDYYYRNKADAEMRNEDCFKQYEEWAKEYTVTVNEELIEKIDA